MDEEDVMDQEKRPPPDESDLLRAELQQAGVAQEVPNGRFCSMPNGARRWTSSFDGGRQLG
jgi:hypothetical protein